jgi:hypothetical protein
MNEAFRHEFTSLPAQKYSLLALHGLIRRREAKEVEESEAEEEEEEEPAGGSRLLSVARGGAPVRDTVVARGGGLSRSGGGGGYEKQSPRKQFQWSSPIEKVQAMLASTKSTCFIGTNVQILTQVVVLQLVCAQAQKYLLYLYKSANTDACSWCAAHLLQHTHTIIYAPVTLPHLALLVQEYKY